MQKKELVVAFINDLASTELVDEIKNRIQKIDIDSVLESGYIEQLIEDNYLSPFPQIQNTERPDRVISALMEGRVAILLDGTPFVLIAPVTFSMLLQSPEDYYERWLPGTLLRLLRFMTAFVSLFAPALYISFISFHPGLIPTKLAISIIGSREGVPFPALIEALIMEVAIEVLREAGLRLPKPIGPAMGIVGGLIIGQAAVEAGIVSPIMVIVVAVTAISSFTIPQYSVGITLRILRFVAMFCAAIFGLYGVILFFLLLCSHLVKLKSFGVPYTSPAVPYRFSDWKDFMVRMPLKNNETSTENNAYKKNYPQKVADDERKWPSVITIPKDRITTSQAVVIIVNYILGTGILTLPRASVEKVKTPDVWLSVILGGILAMVSGVIMVKLSQQFPEKNILPIQSRYCREMDRQIV